jgi:DNA-binding NarL/FixJ family response regulator
VTSVFICDDEPDYRALLRAAVEAEPDFTFAGEAGNGFEGVRAVAELQPDVVLLDLTMPELDGLDALMGVRKLSPETIRVVVTGHRSAWVRGESQAAGADLFLSKDMSPTDICRAVRELMGERELV